MQNSRQNVTTNKPTPSYVYRPDALAIAQPTVSKHIPKVTVNITIITTELRQENWALQDVLVKSGFVRQCRRGLQSVVTCCALWVGLPLLGMGSRSDDV